MIYPICAESAVKHQTNKQMFQIIPYINDIQTLNNPDS